MGQGLTAAGSGQAIDFGKRLRNDLFCVEWGVKPQLSRSVVVRVVYRREVYHLNRELLRERTRCKALEEELENPMNIHRWRKLEVIRSVGLTVCFTKHIGRTIYKIRYLMTILR